MRMPKIGKWKKVKESSGYVRYVYDDDDISYLPKPILGEKYRKITIEVSTPSFGLSEVYGYKNDNRLNTLIQEKGKWDVCFRIAKEYMEETQKIIDVIK